MAVLDYVLRFLSGGKDIVVMLAAATGAWVAFQGLQTWRRQLTGSAEWDLSRRLLRRVYAVRDSIHQVRGGFMSGAEMEDALKKLGRDKPEDKVKRIGLEDPARDAAAIVAAYQVRWGRVQAALSDLAVDALEAEVLWGQQVIAALDPLHQCAKQLQVYLTLYLQSRQEPFRGPSADLNEKAFHIVFPVPDEKSGKDEFAEQLATAILTAEAFIRPHISRFTGATR